MNDGQDSNRNTDNNSAPPEVFVLPQYPHVKIWRYMDFTKFVSMLENRGLYFARADHMGDIFEGSVPTMNRKNWRELYAHLPLSDKFKEAVIENLSCTNRENLKWIFINCWHMNDCESAAMWVIYARTAEAICIQTTFEILQECLGPSQTIRDVQLSKVTYLDYDTEVQPEGNIFFPFLHKRRSFEHEKELRAIIHISEEDRPSSPPDGKWIPVKLERLIQRVYIAPTAPKWLAELIERVISRYGLKLKVEQSLLDKSPVY